MTSLARTGILLLGFLAYALCGVGGGILWPESVIWTSVAADVLAAIAFLPIFPLGRTVPDRPRVGSLRQRPVAWASVLAATWLTVQLTTTVLVASGVSMGPYAGRVDASGHEAAAYAVLTVFLAPVCEELFVRRFLFGNLLVLMPCGAALFVQAAVFSLLHGSQIHLYSALVTGLLFGAVYLYTGSAAACMLAHGTYNLGCLLFSGLRLPSVLFMPGVLIVLNAVLVFGTCFFGHWTADALKRRAAVPEDEAGQA